MVSISNLQGALPIKQVLVVPDRQLTILVNVAQAHKQLLKGQRAGKAVAQVAHSLVGQVVE